MKINRVMWSRGKWLVSGEKNGIQFEAMDSSLETAINIAIKMGKSL